MHSALNSTIAHPIHAFALRAGCTAFHIACDLGFEKAAVSIPKAAQPVTLSSATIERARWIRTASYK